MPYSQKVEVELGLFSDIILYLNLSISISLILFKTFGGVIKLGFMVSDKPRIERFEYEGETYEIEVKDLTWAQKNQIISKATKIDKVGNATFDIDIFNRECLLRILGKCKITSKDGKVREVTFDAPTLLGIKADFGAILEKFIPSPTVEITKEEEKNSERR